MTATTTETARRYVEYVGIDPSLTATGICIICANGKQKLKTIRTTPATFNNRYLRLDFIADSLRDRVQELLNPVIFIERPFVNPKNMTAQQDLLALGHLIRRRFHYGKIPFLDVSPMTLKKFVCGKGNAEKSMMLMRVYQNWPSVPKMITRQTQPAWRTWQRRWRRCMDAMNRLSGRSISWMWCGICWRRGNNDPSPDQFTSDQHRRADAAGSNPGAWRI